MAKIQTLLSYVASSGATKVIDMPFDCTILSLFAMSRMVDQGEFVIATGQGTQNADTAFDGSVLLYGITFSDAASKPFVSFGPLQLNLPMRQHDKLFIRGQGSDLVQVYLTVEVNRAST